MKEKYISLYMDISERISKMSYATRLKVGCLIVRENTILSYGWNGTPTGWDNNCENIEWCSGGGWLSPEEIEEGWPYEGEYTDIKGNVMQGRYRLKTKPEVLHAEMNAIAKISKSTETSENSTMFCTHAPCIECAKIIYQSGIKTLYYRDQYRDDLGIEFLKKGGVDVYKTTK